MHLNETKSTKEQVYIIAEMVVVSKEASTVRKATPNPSCTKSSKLKSSLLTCGVK